MSNLVWRDQVPDGGRLVLSVAPDQQYQQHDYTAGAKVWTVDEEKKIATFDHVQLSNDGQAVLVLQSALQRYSVHITVTFNGAVVSGAIISSRIVKANGTLYGTSPDPHPVAGKSGDVGWQTISIRMKA